MRKPAALLSLAIHGVALVLLFFFASTPGERTPLPEPVRLVAPLRAPRLRLKDGGGGQNQPLPATRGRAPAAHVAKVWVPPAPVRTENSHLIVEQALLDAPEINIQAPVTGDPNGNPGMPSAGPGFKGGIGDGRNGGIGERSGPRLGGDGGRSGSRNVKSPQVIYKVEPEYTEEARKARYQGTVILAIDVDEQGRATNVRVVQGLGLGLDEKAVAAIERWKFRPAIADGRAVRAPAVVEVNFRLL
jgi:TonB family protein